MRPIQKSAQAERVIIILYFSCFSFAQVEYTDHSGNPHIAFAEAPNEALPLDCRPTFNAAWLAKDKFKVNPVTYL